MALVGMTYFLKKVQKKKQDLFFNLKKKIKKSFKKDHIKQKIKKDFQKQKI